jgi:hypothetical protein
MLKQVQHDGEVIIRLHVKMLKQVQHDGEVENYFKLEFKIE